LYFSELHFVFYKFLKFIPNFWNIMKTKNRKTLHTVPGRLRPTVLALLAWPMAISAWPAWPLGAGVARGARALRPRPSWWHGRDELTGGSRATRLAR
jgi:hypothetical protein